MAYDKVQFVGHVISTGTREAPKGKYRYVGLDSDTEDMTQRLKLVATVLDTAFKHKDLAQDTKTLKVLVLPEFFFRGKQGAYPLADVVDTVVPGLRALVQDPKWKDWFFCFGTLLGYWDAGSAGTRITNYALLQRGGLNGTKSAAEAASYVVQKEFLSRVDFVARKKDQKKHPLEAPRDYRGLLWEDVSHDTPTSISGTPRSEIQQRNLDGHGVFKEFDFTWGVEICLDHLQGRLKNSKDLPALNFQLVPSCGARIAQASVAVKKGWVFNVDGSAAPASTLQAATSTHTPPTPVGPLQAVSLAHAGADNLFVNGAGSLVLYSPVPAPGH